MCCWSPSQQQRQNTTPSYDVDSCGCFSVFFIFFLLFFSCNTGAVQQSWKFLRTSLTLTVSRIPASPPRRWLTRRCHPQWDLGSVNTHVDLPSADRAEAPADPHGGTYGSPSALLDRENTHTHTGRCPSCPGSIRTRQSSSTTLLLLF